MRYIQIHLFWCLPAWRLIYKQVCSVTVGFSPILFSRLCCCCLKKNQNALLFLTFSALVANPKKLLYTVANPARGLLNRKKKSEEKVWQHPAPPRALLVRRKKTKKTTRRIHMSRRYASRRYAGGLGPSRVRTRIPTTRRLGQWVSLRKMLQQGSAIGELNLLLPYKFCLLVNVPTLY